jgi:hypothetical protein
MDALLLQAWRGRQCVIDPHLDQTGFAPGNLDHDSVARHNEFGKTLRLELRGCCSGMLGDFGSRKLILTPSDWLCDKRHPSATTAV